MNTNWLTAQSIIRQNIAARSAQIAPPTPMYGLYQTTTCWGYHDDGGGSREYTEILGIDPDRENLRRRWNRTHNAKRKALRDEGEHQSYIDDVAPNFKSRKFTLSYNGSNGGGYASVEHRLEIKSIPQFDDKSC